ncbi:uncharacterized protein EI90DRAFT_1605261 [Cantharellus anzutake]|uniref:uncharacterized protein n=1 Tax=Cantharellus anzutake TaxID=1750568 RepID=UPI0019082CDB|nr:uncharacterized protein EI90DRAFT_1605261 [Cantharellus anzutake]KAF8328142.1 hypothetical protein EI90DRAFT_1605261 [Cantharellus anzutake]
MASIVSSPPRPEHSAPQTSNTQPCVQSAAVSGAIAGDEPGLFTPRANPQPEVSTYDAYAFDRRPLIRYSRRVLLHLSKSPLVALPPNMPEFNMCEWTEPHVKKDDHSSSTTSPSSNRHRARREQLDDDTRHMFKSQFPQSSQMGNFRHHSSRLDDKEPAY